MGRWRIDLSCHMEQPVRANWHRKLHRHPMLPDVHWGFVFDSDGYEAWHDRVGVHLELGRAVGKCGHPRWHLVTNELRAHRAKLAHWIPQLLIQYVSTQYAPPVLPRQSMDGISRHKGSCKWQLAIGGAPLLTTG